ncbi:MAG: hypothetical protein MJ135_05175 [Oscillospiraceae bacterium]|nr:hypothetical protein [Oscillospiraceae bacterium]
MYRNYPTYNADESPEIRALRTEVMLFLLENGDKCNADYVKDCSYGDLISIAIDSGFDLSRFRL